ncbi:MAG: peptidylprolyl isomerase [Clostridia bacterium]|nr:peptidylprolyl isomerase [Clostridia bacterium]
MKKLFALLITVCLVTCACGAPELVGTHIVDIVVKDFGTITVELNGDAAPKTVGNFVDLVESGFYDGLTFHRIIEGFMMQGGDPEGTGMGGSDRNVEGEFLANGYANPISHTRGTISMARNGYDMNSASSQFFIMHEDDTRLDGQYAAFGHVIEGIEVVDAICEEVRPYDNNGSVHPQMQPVIESITVRK